MCSISTNSSVNKMSFINAYLDAQLERYRQTYQTPVIKPFPNYPVSQIRSISDLPVWNYKPEYPPIQSINDLPVWNYQPGTSHMTLYSANQGKASGKTSTQKPTSLTDLATNWSVNLQSAQLAPVSKQGEPKISEKQRLKKVSIPTYNGKKTTKTLTKDFVDKVKDIAKKVNCDYRDLLGVMNSESGLDPTARNRHSGAIGLLQFTGIAIKDLNQVYGMNLTKDKIANMSAMEQLDLVEKYLLRSKSFKFNSGEKLDSADLYAIVYRPAFAGKNVIATKNDGKTYSQNRGLDLDKDGMITRQDLAMAVQRKHINVNLVA